MSSAWVYTNRWPQNYNLFELAVIQIRIFPTVVGKKAPHSTQYA